MQPSDYWRQRAKEVRAEAEGLATEANRRQMLGTAKKYDVLAKQAERSFTVDISDWVSYASIIPIDAQAAMFFRCRCF